MGVQSSLALQNFLVRLRLRGRGRTLNGGFGPVLQFGYDLGLGGSIVRTRDRGLDAGQGICSKWAGLKRLPFGGIMPGLKRLPLGGMITDRTALADNGVSAKVADLRRDSVAAGSERNAAGMTRASRMVEERKIDPWKFTFPRRLGGSPRDHGGTGLIIDQP